MKIVTVMALVALSLTRAHVGRNSGGRGVLLALQHHPAGLEQ